MRSQKWLRQGHGQYQEIPDQEAWFRELKQSERVVCHFYRGTTWRCQIVDKHLERLAREHPETRFVKVDPRQTLAVLCCFDCILGSVLCGRFGIQVSEPACVR